LRVYDRMSDRSKMPSNRRVFLETVLDRSKEPITERSLKPEEIDALGKLIRRKYEPIQKPLAQYEAHLRARLAQHEQAMLAGNRDRMIYPEILNRYLADSRAIRDFREGFVTQDFLDLAAGRATDRGRQLALQESGTRGMFNVPPHVQYEDYPIDQKRARTASAGRDPYASLSTLLGRFRFGVQDGNLTIEDNYDFNPPKASFTGTEGRSTGASIDGVAAAAPGAVEGQGSGLYSALRDFAGTAVPPGQGREVRIRLNSLAPEPINALAAPR